MNEALRFPELQLDFVESRVLGSILEKETTTPDYYPMTAKAIEAACNQSSNRFPTTRLSSEEIEAAIQRLRKKEILMQVHISGSRVPKYEHQLAEILDMTSAENAIMTVLLLRSVQTAGEIKQRTERMHPFEKVEQVEELLQGFMEYPSGPLVRELPVGSGRRVKTYGHLLGGETGFDTIIHHTPVPLPPETEGLEVRVAALEEKLAKVLAELGMTEEQE
ncbi:DUF480 domain-containing protein [Verrucomicrobiaceae bacterium 227]